MERRIALKNLGLAFGYVVAAPTLLSIVQSCKNENGVAWTPEFFTDEEGKVLRKLVDIILPKTDSPSASEVNVHLFIDQYINVANTQEQKDLFRAKMSSFTSLAVSNTGKDRSQELNVGELEATLARCLQLKEEDLMANNRAMQNYTKAIAAGEIVELDVNSGAAAFARELRGWVINGYKSSEEIAKNFLAFDPIPGKFVPCGNLEELTGGRAWA